MNRVVGLFIDEHLAALFGRVLEDVALAIAAGGFAGGDPFVAVELVSAEHFADVDVGKTAQQVVTSLVGDGPNRRSDRATGGVV